ncbi:MAG: hypothetical protein K6G85_11230 [Eubacterium sp.]|nr:hypothetical protein [Eubacterium sp.]
MQGAIDYLRKVRDICRSNKGSCRDCPLGNQVELKDTRCPRLIEPWKWTDSTTTDMVRQAH